MKCPFCSEDILDNAQVCKHCGRDFLMVRPLLDQVQALMKRTTDVEGQIAQMIDAQKHPRRQPATPAEGLPAIPRATSVVFAVLCVVIAGLFIGAIIDRNLIINITNKGATQPADFRLTIYASAALVFFPAVFGFLCENTKEKPFWTDVITALVVSALSIVAIQLIRWELVDGHWWPNDWYRPPNPDWGFPANTWSTLLLDAVTLFFSFKAGTFFRYWMYLRRDHHRAPVTFATPLSKRIVGRMGGSNLTPAELEAQIKRVDALIHSLSGIGSAGIAVTAYVTHLH